MDGVSDQHAAGILHALVASREVRRRRTPPRGREAQERAAHHRDVPLPRRPVDRAVPVRLDLLHLRLLCGDAGALDPRHGDARPRQLQWQHADPSGLATAGLCPHTEGRGHRAAGVGRQRMYTLYWSPASANMTPHAMLEDIGAPYELIKVDTSKGEQRRPDYLKINPHGRVPALAYDGDKIVYETTAIALFL